MNPKKGLERLVVRLRPETIAALKAEALRRAQERGSLQLNASELVQEALDEKLATKRAPAKRRK